MTRYEVRQRTIYDVVDVQTDAIYDSHATREEADECAAQQTEHHTAREREANEDARARGEIA
jgi:hypothetical protein